MILSRNQLVITTSVTPLELRASITTQAECPDWLPFSPSAWSERGEIKAQWMSTAAAPWTCGPALFHHEQGQKQEQSIKFLLNIFHHESMKEASEFRLQHMLLPYSGNQVCFHAYLNSIWFRWKKLDHQLWNTMQGPREFTFIMQTANVVRPKLSKPAVTGFLPYGRHQMIHCAKHCGAGVMSQTLGSRLSSYYHPQWR